jgi:hypothetical protein
MADKAPDFTAVSPKAPLQPLETRVAASSNTVAKLVPTAQKIAEERFFEVAQYRQNEWFLRARRTFSFEDVLKRECWAQVAGKLRVGDKIIAMREDGAFYAELIVFAVGINWAETRVLAGPIHGSALLAGSRAADDFEIKYMGTIQNWVVIRKEDGYLVKNDGTILTEEAAQAWLREYLNTIAKSRMP